MKKLGLAVLVALPLVAGCYADDYPPAYYAGPGYYGHGYYHRHYYGPRPVYVAPPRVHVYW